jgi:hypothetical protein
MRPTRVSTLVIVAVVFAVADWLVLRSVYQRLPPLPWTGVPALLVAAIAEAWTGRDLRARISGRRGLKPAAPLFVSRMVALAKASSLAAAIIAGLAAGFDIYLSGMLTAAVPRQDALTAAVTFVAAIVLACAALYLEYCCRVPNAPDDDDRDSAAPGGSTPRRRALDHHPGLLVRSWRRRLRSWNQGPVAGGLSCGAMASRAYLQAAASARFQPGTNRPAPGPPAAAEPPPFLAGSSRESGSAPDTFTGVAALPVRPSAADWPAGSARLLNAGAAAGGRSGWRAVAVDDLAVGAGDLAGAVGVDDQLPARRTRACSMADDATYPCNY